MDKPYKRRQFLINKSFQYRYIAWVVGAMAAAAFVILLDVFITLHRHCVDAGLQISVMDLYNPTAPLTVIKLIVFAAGLIVTSLVLSHRIAGPLYRFKVSADKVAAGDLSLRVTLRQEDEFRDFQETFNAMLESLRVKVAKDAATAAEIVVKLDLLAKDASMSPATVESLRRLSAELSTVGKSIKTV
jgi:methyl-accepting chemotaxis protein